jgi:hypothetical protein
VGGGLQEQSVAKIRPLDPERCLVIGIEVGKYEALCLIADHRSEIVGEAVPFPLTEPGAQLVEQHLEMARATRGALSVRIGVETAGHYHRLVVSRLAAAGHDVVEFTPRTSKPSGRRRGSAASRLICATQPPLSSWS